MKGSKLLNLYEDNTKNFQLLIYIAISDVYLLMLPTSSDISNTNL